MNVPAPPLPHLNIPMAVAITAIILMAGAYLLFLWASWQQYQADRQRRDLNIDELLSRLPVKDSGNAAA